jgi:hypothetical protein
MEIYFLYIKASYLCFVLLMIAMDFIVTWSFEKKESCIHRFFLFLYEKFFSKKNVYYFFIRSIMILLFFIPFYIKNIIGLGNPTYVWFFGISLFFFYMIFFLMRIVFLLQARN